MGITPVAQHFHSPHEEAVVGFSSDILFREGDPEAGPPSPGIEFCVRAKQVVAATGALIGSMIMRVPILTGKGSLRSLLARNLKLFGRKELLPLRLRFTNFVTHGPFSCPCVETPRRGVSITP